MDHYSIQMAWPIKWKFPNQWWRLSYIYPFGLSWFGGNQKVHPKRNEPHSVWKLLPSQNKFARGVNVKLAGVNVLWWWVDKQTFIHELDMPPHGIVFLKALNFFYNKREGLNFKFFICACVHAHLTSCHFHSTTKSLASSIMVRTLRRHSKDSHHAFEAWKA